MADPAPEPAAADDASLEVFSNPVCLLSIFSQATDPCDLGRAAAVCRLWRSVLEPDDVWKSVYLRSHSKLQPYEDLGSYHRAFQRYYSILNLPECEKLDALSGSALCYNPASRSLVSFSGRLSRLSCLDEDGNSRQLQLEGAGGASADRPLLASARGSLVLLAAADGVLQVLDVSSMQLLFQLPGHPSFINSLAADGDLVASSCSHELRIWDLASRRCLARVPHGLPLVSPVAEPRVVASEALRVVALANATFPAPESAVRVLSAEPGSAGAELAQLPVNAVASMAIVGTRLFVASTFYGRHPAAAAAGGAGTAERAFTVVASIWDLVTWKRQRLISPRMSCSYPLSMMAGLPIIHITQDLLLCGTLRPRASPDQPVSCQVHAWRLQPAHDEGGAGASALRVVAHPNPQARGGGAGGSGGGGGAGVDAGGRLRMSAVTLVVADDERDKWSPALEGAPGCVRVLLTTPSRLVVASDAGVVSASAIRLAPGAAGAVAGMAPEAAAGPAVLPVVEADDGSEAAADGGAAPAADGAAL